MIAPPLSGQHTPGDRAERLCHAFLQTDIDFAFTFLRLAEVESKLGNSARASELIERAIRAYKTAMQFLDDMPAPVSEERSELQASIRRLFEAIHIAAYHHAAVQN